MPSPRSLVQFLALGSIAIAAGAGTSRMWAQEGATRAFTGATLIDGTNRPAVANATLLVRDGRVVAAGSAAQVSIPAGAVRVPLDGKVIIPGLVNSHGHVTAPGDLSTYAEYGVTTIFSLGGEPESVFAARASQATPGLSHARVFLAGTVLTATTADEARAQVAAVAAQKVDIVKIRVDDNLGVDRKMPSIAYKAIIVEAHKRGMRVAAHLYYLSDARDLLASGVDFIAHSVRDSLVDAPFVAKLKSSGICYTPTLIREISTFAYETTPPFFTDSFFLAHANQKWVAMMQEPARQEATRTSKSAQTYKAQLPVALKNLKTLSDAGVPIAMGTDTGPVGRFQGFFELMEIEMMVKNAGLTPRQALTAATRDAAKCMHIDREVGTLESGKWGDFVVLDASPLIDITNIRRISAVYIAGNRVKR
ncbi:MAG: amidohydrolase family protein [Gemmatimonadaceae bacterium]